MSLQTRIVVLVAAVLLGGVALGFVFSMVQSRHALSAEIQAAMSGGVQTVRSAFEDLPRSDHQELDLDHLVATFDGNRHVAAQRVEAGVVRRRSIEPVFGKPAPGWFERLVAPATAPITLVAPGRALGREAIVLRAVPDADVSALWVQLSGVTALLGLSTFAGLVLVVLVVRTALASLRELSIGFAEIGRGDYRGRVRERGPAEILRLERSFNDMAERLTVMGRHNRALEQQLLTLQDEERTEIARDLHDDVGPHLFAVSLDAQVITQLMASGRTTEIASQVEAIQAGVGHVQREIRSIVVRLRPARVTELGLDRAVQDLVKFWRDRRAEIAFSVELNDTEAGISDTLKDTAFRILQEAVNNAVRHAAPSCVGIWMSRERGCLVVKVENDGVGPAPAQAGPGFGLIGMRERVASVGGDLEVGRADKSQVWSVVATLPLAVETTLQAGARAV